MPFDRRMSRRPRLEFLFGERWRNLDVVTVLSSAMLEILCLWNCHLCSESPLLERIVISNSSPWQFMKLKLLSRALLKKYWVPILSLSFDRMSARVSATSYKLLFVSSLSGKHFVKPHVAVRLTWSSIIHCRSLFFFRVENCSLEFFRFL